MAVSPGGVVLVPFPTLGWLPSATPLPVIRLNAENILTVVFQVSQNLYKLNNKDWGK